MREFGLRLIIIGTPPERPLMEQVVSAMGDSSDVRIWHLQLLQALLQHFEVHNHHGEYS